MDWLDHGLCFLWEHDDSIEWLPNAKIDIHKGLKQRDHLTAFLFLLFMNNAVALNLFCGS
jgi:hypothetical protein